MIVDAATPLFAQKGFIGTTTKEIAKAACISEALLYRHFPSKEALYQEIQAECSAHKQGVTDALMALPPSLDTFILGLYYYIELSVNKGPYGDGEESAKAIRKLTMHSLLEDGKFLKSHIEMIFEPVHARLNDCIEAARKDGYVIENWVPPKLSLWYIQHLLMGMGFIAMPEEEVINYGASKKELAYEVMRFVLRGLGIKDDVIAEKTTPNALAAMVEEFQSQQQG